MVRPGLYQEGMVISKPLEIIGDGAPGEIIVQVSGKDVIMFQTTMGRVVNLTLRQMGGEHLYCVDIAQGRLEVEDCDITSQSLSCVGIHGGADPRLRRNRIHGSKESGVIIYENAQGTLEDNDIFGNGFAGVEIGTINNPTLRRNRIHDNKQDGVFVEDFGQGVVEDNDIFRNGHSGVCTKGGGNPLVRNNRINKNTKYGVEVDENGGGKFENNTFTDNVKGNWSISADSEANVTRINNKE
jgi:F-box protein 11